MGMRDNYMQGQSSGNLVLRSCWRIRLPPARLIKLIMATKGSSAGGATDSRNDLELEGLRLRNEKLRTEIENLKKGVGGEKITK